MKRIIMCADGTWNLRDQIDKVTGKRRATNVTKLARRHAVVPRTDEGIDQIVFYQMAWERGPVLIKLPAAPSRIAQPGIEGKRLAYRTVAYAINRGGD